jgi:hypothetical protein
LNASSSGNGSFSAINRGVESVIDLKASKGEVDARKNIAERVLRGRQLKAVGEHEGIRESDLFSSSLHAPSVFSLQRSTEATIQMQQVKHSAVKP